MNSGEATTLEPSALFVEFSIITVVLNDIEGFQATRRSIAALTGPTFEWIVVDGRSRDGLVEHLKNGDSLVSKWVSEQDSGIYDAMNKGVSLARGEYVVFMNAGDRFGSPESLALVEESVNAAKCRPDVVFGGARVSFENGMSFYRAPRQAERTIWHGLPANHQATYYRRACLQDVPYDLSFRVCGDYYLIASLMRRGVRAIYVHDALALFRGGDTSHRMKGKLLAEPYRIQRDVLNQPMWLSALSGIRRLVVTGVFMVMNAWPSRRSLARR